MTNFIHVKCPCCGKDIGVITAAMGSALVEVEGYEGKYYPESLCSECMKKIKR